MQLPDAPLGALLPWWLNKLEMRRLMSSDGQVYVSDDAGGEFRVEPAATFDLYEVALGEAQEAAPQWCDPSRVVRHLQWESRQCLDCGHTEKVAHFAWDLRRCPICWSRSVEVRADRIEPPLPPSFRAVGDLPRGHATRSMSQLEYEWGVSAEDDARQLFELAFAFRNVKRAHAWLFLLSLFADTLLKLYERDGDIIDRYNLTLNVGNVHEALFRATGLPTAGAAAVNAFQAAVTMDENPVLRSMALHSFGMTVIYILEVYDEGEAERVTARPTLRADALAALREALRLVDEAEEVDPKGAVQQRFRVRYALGDLLRRGNATTSQLGEAEQVLRELDLEEARVLRLDMFIQAALQETRLVTWPGPDEDLDRWMHAAEDLTQLIQESGTFKLSYRWHWAFAIGQFLLRMGLPDQARPYLESAVTFIMKDTGFEADPVALLGDAERFSQVFTLLALVYVNGGEPYEALALVETFRGRVLQMSELTESERAGLASKDELARLDRFGGFGGVGPEESPVIQVVSEGVSGTTFGPFTEDYDLPGLEDRIAELQDALLDERTALVSLSLTEQILESGGWAFAVILRAPGSPNPRIGSALWRVSDDLLTALRSDSYRRRGSFREQRLRTLSGQLWESLLAPLTSQLGESSRLLLALPGPFGNVPIELATTWQVDQPVRRMSLIPALAFGLRPLRRRNRGQERLLVIGYSGDDLPDTVAEVEELRGLFHGAVSLLAGADCTKRQVIEELNGEYDFVHIACHGTFDDRNPLESSLWLRDYPRTDAARLRAEEIQTLVRFRRSPVVTLSACSTALTAESRSNTWNGLPGALLRAGARALVGARWPVKDGVAAAFMTGLYRKLRASDASALACFHEVQDELRAGGAMEDWASFGYLGLP